MRTRKKILAVLLAAVLAVTATALTAFAAPNGICTLFRKESVEEQPAYTKSELHAKRGDYDIYGILYTPNTKEEKIPVVILSHGFKGTHAGMETYAENLAEHGYAAYIYDFCGGGILSRSDGATTEMSVLTEKEDLKAVMRMIRQQKTLDADRLYLLGASQGGAVSAMTAADLPDEIAGMILLYPALCIPADAGKRCPDPTNIPETMDIMGMTVGKVYHADVIDMDIYEEIKGYDKDVLIFHGDADEIVPISYSEQAESLYPHAELVTMPGADHGFEGADLQAAKGHILTYLDAHTRA